MDCEDIVYSDHAVNQMFRRDISVDDVSFTVSKGEVISEYPNDKPYPSYLLLSFMKDRPLHVVLAKDGNKKLCIVVTAYEPQLDIWEFDFKTKRKN